MGKMMVNGVSYSGGAENLNELHDVDITSPTAGDVVKWDPTSLKWINGEGGGGNVDDVCVNGTSVLDSNKIAQITSYREVTQAEYDALPASKESDGVLYCIKDKATADTTVAPIIYSEEEREVGVWTDGKPLYQKTVFPSISEINAHSFSDSDFANAEMIMIIDGYYTLTNDYLKVALNQYESSSYWCRAGFRNDKSIYLYVNGYSVTGSASITLQYTKTTDTPGSGKYAPSGVPAVHYSENEQVVGTWVDGSTVYEKTVHIENTTSSFSDYINGVAVEDVNLPLSMCFAAKRNDIFMCGNGCNRSEQNANYMVAVRFRNGYIQYRCDAYGTEITDIYVTIRYTKST